MNYVIHIKISVSYFRSLSLSPVTALCGGCAEGTRDTGAGQHKAFIKHKTDYTQTLTEVGFDSDSELGLFLSLTLSLSLFLNLLPSLSMN